MTLLASVTGCQYRAVLNPIFTGFRDHAVAYRNLPINTKLIGYARSKLSDEDLREKVKSGLDGASHRQDDFLDLCSYVQGAYDTPEGFQGLQEAIKQREDEHSGCPLGRIFYLALPPSVYPQASLPSRTLRTA